MVHNGVATTILQSEADAPEMHSRCSIESQIIPLIAVALQKLPPRFRTASSTIVW